MRNLKHKHKEIELCMKQKGKHFEDEKGVRVGKGKERQMGQK